MIRLRSSIAALLVSLLTFVAGFPLERVAAAYPLASFVYPIVGTRVSSEFGVRNHPVLHYVKHHDGLDLAAPEGALIRAIKKGRVVFADPYGSYGKFIVIQHDNGLTSHYGHCSSIRVHPGELVTAGQIIGAVGQTGRVTGPHLHLEIRLNGVAQNPEVYLPGVALAGEG